jgi:hypothetical protein
MSKSRACCLVQCQTRRNCVWSVSDPLADDADSVECPACGERKTVTVKTADGVIGPLDCPACHRTGRLSPCDDPLPR